MEPIEPPWQAVKEWNRRAYPQGNYEVVSARCAEGGGEMLVTAALRMLEEIRIANGANGAEEKE
jgi:hypothetical protein